MIKAIRTKYKGIRFRSRLEARWAVYFDVLDLKWEYEKEGYALNNQYYYLPDFWLPEVKMWAEVKPEKFTEIEKEKARLLAKGTGFPVLMLEGIPDYKTYLAIEPEGYRIDYLISNHHDYPKSEGRFYSNTEYCDGEIELEEHIKDEMKEAIEAARGANFEKNQRFERIKNKAQRFNEFGIVSDESDEIVRRFLDRLR